MSERSTLCQKGDSRKVEKGRENKAVVLVDVMVVGIGEIPVR